MEKTGEVGKRKKTEKGENRRSRKEKKKKKGVNRGSRKEKKKLKRLKTEEIEMKIKKTKREKKRE